MFYALERTPKLLVELLSVVAIVASMVTLQSIEVVLSVLGFLQVKLCLVLTCT